MAIEKESPKNLEQPLKDTIEEYVTKNFEFAKPNNEINICRPELPSRICSEKLDLSIFSNVIYFFFMIFLLFVRSKDGFYLFLKNKNKEGLFIIVFQQV